MSRSNPTPTQASNPCKRWFQWDSNTKQFKYYDKELNDGDGGNVFVPLPFKFIVLDVLSTVAGFNEKTNSSFISNEVRNYMNSTASEVLCVRLKKEVVFNGTWNGIKEAATAKGAKFAHSVYIGYYDDNKVLQIGNIKLYGASLGSWMDAIEVANKKGKKVEDCAFQVATTKPGKKGSVTWNEPVFDEIKINDATNKKAIALDEELQAYLSEYLKKGATNTNTTTTQDETPEEVIQQQNSIEESAAPQGASDFDDDPF